MRFSGLMDCDERFKRAHQVAVLQYKGVEEDYPPGETNYEESKKPGSVRTSQQLMHLIIIKKFQQLNSLNKGTEHNGTLHITLPRLTSLDGWDDSLKEVADFQYYVAYDFYKLDNPHFHKWPYYGFENGIF